MMREVTALGALHLILANDLGELASFKDAVEPFALQAGMPEMRRLDLHLALEEVVVNIINHAWEGGKHEIDVFLVQSPHEVRARIEDDGRPFNPLNHPLLDVGRPLEECCAGGMGIHMVRQLSNEQTYERLGGRNVLQLTFRWSSP